MSDGLTVPFALAAGLSGAVDSTGLIITAGLAEVAAGAMAMGLGGYLAARIDAEHFVGERAREDRETRELPETEAAEVAQVVGLVPAPIAVGPVGWHARRGDGRAGGGRAELAALHRTGPGLLAPFFAGFLDPSSSTSSTYPATLSPSSAACSTSAMWKLEHPARLPARAESLASCAQKGSAA
jgi:hypothetical protein